MIDVHRISADVKVVIDPRAVVAAPASIATRIDEIWQAELVRKGGPPFNEPVFSVASCAPDLITVWEADYKSYLTQRRDPALFDVLRIRPLAVTGLLKCADGIVFGQRSNDVEQDKGLWELVPSGGVDGSARRPDGTIDLSVHLLKELAEETGIHGDRIAAPARPFALVEDVADHVMDVGALLRTSLTAKQVAEAFHQLENREYTALEVIETSCLRSFAETQGSRLVAVSAALLKATSYSADPDFR